MTLSAYFMSKAVFERARLSRAYLCVS